MHKHDKLKRKIGNLEEDRSILVDKIVEMESRLAHLEKHLDMEANGPGGYLTGQGPASPVPDGVITYYNTPIPITRHQVEAMQGTGAVISAYDPSNGWLLVGIPDDPDSGVWLDQHGDEQHG